MLFAPLMLQAVFGLSALAAGAGLIPLLLALIAATAVSGAMIARNGRYRIFLLMGAALGAAGLALLSRTAPGTPLWATLGALAVSGAGIGFLIQVVVLAGQNAVALRDLGVATGALNFFKTYGGAAAGALFGALLAARLPAGHADAAQALAAFDAVFFWAVPLMLLAFLLAWRMPEKPLSPAIIDIAEGRLDVPEY
jgi:MFS family permease